MTLARESLCGNEFFHPQPTESDARLVSEAGNQTLRVTDLLRLSTSFLVDVCAFNKVHNIIPLDSLPVLQILIFI